MSFSRRVLLSAAALLLSGLPFGAFAETTTQTFANVGTAEISGDAGVELINRGNDTYALVFTNAQTTTFTFNSDWTVTEFLVVGGGGAGGGNGGAGGGGGGVIWYTNALLAADNVRTRFTSDQSISLTVGAGGTGAFKSPGVPGGSSSLAIGTAVYTAFGGGGGGNYNDPPSVDRNAVPGVDGTGCGAAGYADGGTGVTTTMDTSKPGYYANNSGTGTKESNQTYCAGGGGAGEVGGNAVTTGTKMGGKGGDGLPCSITGSEIYYAAGGGGSTSNPNTTKLEDEAVGGLGGGGHASAKGSRTDGVGTEPSDPSVHASGFGCGGGGGGGGSGACCFGGNGSAGIVVLAITPAGPEPDADKPTVSAVRSALTPLFVRLDATLTSAGQGHSAATVSFAFGKETAGDYETVTNALLSGDSLSILRTGLEQGASYEWKIRVENAAGKVAETNGSFTVPTADEGPGTGGTLTDLGNGEYVHVFTSETGGEFTFEAPSVPVFAEVLAVGGGGAGGVIGGGGGAGGFGLASNVVLSGSYRVTVGAGGAWPVLDSMSYPRSGPHYDGKDTMLVGEDGTIPVFAHGGGGGGSASTAAAKGNDGGSGGGASGEEIATGGNSLDDQGNPGGGFASAMPGASAGGGGAGEPGGLLVNKKSGSGGAGLPCSITGTNVWYAGGGGGGVASDWWYGYQPGEGGKGGGGKGGAHLSNEERTFGEPGENGTNGLGGGGGGSSGNRGDQCGCRPGNGGSGILVLRYKTTDISDPIPRIRLVGIEPKSDTTALLRWDIPFAGPDTSLCDVTATWSEDLSTASFTTLLASGTAGPDQAALPNLLPGRSYEVFITARNGLAGGVATSETLRFTMPADGAMPQTFQPAQPVVGSFTCVNSTDGPFADLEGTLLQPGTGSGFEDCTLAVYFGTNNVLSKMEKRIVATAPDADGKFAFRLENIPLDTIVHATVEVSNGAGFIDRLGTSFRTYSDTTLEEPTASSEQLVVTFRDQVRKIGCGTTTAWFRWSTDGGRTWEESPLGSFSPTDPTNGWTVVRTAPVFNREIHYEFFCSNAIAVHSVSNSIVPLDRSVYRWDPTKLQGAWDSADSWLCDVEPAVGYPTAGSTAVFSHMTTQVRVTMTNEDAAVHCLQIDPGDGSYAKNKDLVFIGRNGGAFAIDTFGSGDTVRMEDSHLTFQSLKVQFPGEYTLDFGPNCTLSLLNGSEVRANLRSSEDNFTLELTGDSCLHSTSDFSFTGKSPRIFLSDRGFLETTGRFNFGTGTQVYMEGRNPAMQSVKGDNPGFIGTATVDVSLPEDVYGDDYPPYEGYEAGYCDEVGQRRAIIRTANRHWTWPNFSAKMTFHIAPTSPGRSHGRDKDYLLMDFRANNFTDGSGITDTNKVSVTGLREGEYAYWVWDYNKPNPSRLYVHTKSDPATVLLFR